MTRGFWLGLLAGLTFAAHAETLYVGERILLGLYQEPNSQGERLMLLQSADQIEVLDRRDGFAQVRTANGTVGWVSERYLTAERPSSLRVTELESEAAALRQELENAREELRRAGEQLASLQTAATGPAPATVPEPNGSRSAAAGEATARWPLWIGLAAVGLLAGFGVGVWWIDRRVRSRFSGLRPY